MGISDQKYLAEAIANLKADVESIRIGGAKRSQQFPLENGVPFLLADGIAKIIMDFLEG